MASKSISYSQFSLYANCPKRWKLDYADGLRKYEQNINTIFGSAFHKTIQHYLTTMYNISAKEADSIDINEYLKEALQEEYKTALSKNGNTHFTTSKELADFYMDGIAILKYFKNHRRVYFSARKQKLVGIEVALKIPLNDFIDFIGFIDVVIQDVETGRIKVFDIKTSTRGWSKDQKKDLSKTAQLVLYKNYYGQQLGVDPDMIDVEYLIVRRKINEDGDFPMKRIQTFIPSSGKPTRNKVQKMLTEFVSNAFTSEGDYNLNGNFPAISSSACKYCPYKDDEARCSKKERIIK